MNDHLTKPIAPDRLIAALARWIGSPTDAEATRPPVRAQPQASCPPELLALASLDAREGIRRIGGNVEAYRRQLGRFAASHAGAGARLLELLEQSDAQHANEMCHALVGVTGNLGARAVFDQLSVLSASLRLGKLPTADQVDAASRQLQALLADIDSLGLTEVDATIASDDGAVTESGGSAQQTALLLQLEHALQFDLGRCEQILARLREATAGTDDAADIEVIARHVNDFAIDAAAAVTNELRLRLSPVH